MGDAIAAPGSEAPAGSRTPPVRTASRKCEEFARLEPPTHPGGAPHQDMPVTKPYSLAAGANV